MAFPDSGFIEIFPATTQIISGQWAFNNDAFPQPSRPVGDIDAFYAARTKATVGCPSMCRNVEYPAASGIFEPAIGDYELQFSASSIGFNFYDSSYPGPIAYTTDMIKADFPMGMEINQLRLAVNNQAVFYGSARDRRVDQIDMNYFGSNFYDWPPPAIPGSLSGNALSPATGTGAIIPSFFTNWSITRVLKPFGFKISVNSVSSVLLNQHTSGFPYVTLLGVYNTQLFRMNQPGLADGEASALPGDILTLENPQQRLGNFDPDQFQIYWDDPTGTDPDFPGMVGVYIPRRNIITFTSSILRFRMPVGLGIPYGGRRLMLVGTTTGVFFDGKFPLQNYNIMLVNGSGLYRLTPNKRNDTYYDRSVTPVETVDLAIPQPRAKSGFFNG